MSHQRTDVVSPAAMVNAAGPSVETVASSGDPGGAAPRSAESAVAYAAPMVHGVRER